MFALLSTDRTAEARDTIVAALDDEQERADALRWVQPFADPPVQSAFRKAMSARIRAIQRDPAVLRVVVRYGTILDWSLTSAVPAAAELPAGPKATSWRCGDDASWQLATVPGSTRPPDKQP